MSTGTHARPVLGGGRLAIVLLLVAVLVAAGVLVGRLVITANPFGPSSPVALQPPRFVEEAIAAGVKHTYAGDDEYFVGGGVAAFDCDADGRTDLFLAGGCGPVGAVPERERDRRSAAVRTHARPGD